MNVKAIATSISLLAASCASAEESPFVTPSSLTSSITNISPDGGEVAAISATWEEWFNDASSIRIILAGKTESPRSKAHFLREIPVFADKKRQEVRVRSTADCFLETFAIKTIKGESTLYILKRDKSVPKGTYLPQSSPAKLITEIYSLRRNDTQEPGRPPLYFERDRVVRNTDLVCSETDALETVREIREK